MALSRCNKCGHVVEHEREQVGIQIPCTQCGASTPVYDSVFFVNQLLKQFFALRSERDALRTAIAAPEGAPEIAVAGSGIDFHNSDHLSSPDQHKAITEWFRAKGISVGINAAAVDTTGFFDEAAVAIGNDYETLGEICERIRYAQSKEFTSTLIHLDKKSPEAAAALQEFARRLHQYSLVARYFDNKPEKNIRLVLQNAPSVRKFFAGEWLEWYALMVALRVCDERRVHFACARNLTLDLGNAEKRELDVFFLLDGRRPLYIECKTGEYRQDLDKYVALRKRLDIEAKYFMICVADMPPDQAKGLSAMYDLSFLNTQTLGPHLAALM